jgi:anti-anti-sigma factor
VVTGFFARPFRDSEIMLERSSVRAHDHRARRGAEKWGIAMTRTQPGDTGGLLQMTSEVRPEAVTVHAEGEIDLDTCGRFRDAIVAAGLEAPVLLDLSAVTFLDSSGIRALLEARRAVSPAPVVLVAPSPPVMRVLTLTRLCETFEVVGRDGLDG